MLCLSIYYYVYLVVFFLFKQKTAYELRISDWSSDVCSSDLVADAAEAANYKTYGVTRKEPRGWARLQARFDLGEEPHEPNRFGWIVEIDPYDPASTPVKRTALGRFRHRSEEHTSELQSLMRPSYAVLCLKKKKKKT